MIKPAFVAPGDEVTTVGRAFGTPVVVKGWTWLPAAEVVAALVLAWADGRRRPQHAWRRRLLTGAAMMPVVLGSEWCHNFAHAMAAQAVGRPMDAMRIFWGTPLLVYYDLEDPTVTPRRHILRALGGPIFNMLVAPLAWLLRRRTRPGTLARDVADAAVATNVFIGTVGLVPIPGIDGGAVTKWALVARGRTPAQADIAVQKINGVLAAGLAAGAVAAFRGRRPWLGGLMVPFALTALAIAAGWLREQAPRGPEA